MMNSNILSRMLPSSVSPSIYETIKHDDDASGNSDIEERAAMALDEVNLQQSLHNYDPEDAGNSHITTQSVEFLSQGQRSGHPTKDAYSTRSGRRRSGSRRARWSQHLSPPVAEADEGEDDDVPASLLIEGHNLEDMPRPPAPPAPESRRYSAEVSHGIDASSNTHGKQGLSSPSHRRPQQFLPTPIIQPVQRPGRLGGLASASRKDKAMWRWANVENLDNFLKDVYIYYLGNGIWSILLSRALNLLYVDQGVDLVSCLFVTTFY